MAGLVGTFSELTKHIHLKVNIDKISIDNTVFKLHYKFTTAIFFVSAILVTSRQYFGEHIKCMTGTGSTEGERQMEKVINTFCFFTSTFTMVDFYDDDLVKTGSIPHPGIGPYHSNSTAPIIKHAYYQWVPFVLFGQGIMFLLTHLFWKHYEGGRLKRLLTGLENAAFALSEKEIQVQSTKIPSKKKREDQLKFIQKIFIDNYYISNSWPMWLITFEFLNFWNVIFQAYLINRFLGGKFYSLGKYLLRDGLDDSDVLDEVFPKVTKCTFYKFGPSGTMQTHDAMCIMALNVINEKIYSFLWFWFLLLFIASLLAIIWRLLTIFLHSRCQTFNYYAFSYNIPKQFSAWNKLKVTRKFYYKDWLFLKYLGKNMDSILFNELLLDLAGFLESDKKPLVNLMDLNVPVSNSNIDEKRISKTEEDWKLA